VLEIGDLVRAGVDRLIDSINNLKGTILVKKGVSLKKRDLKRGNEKVEDTNGGDLILSELQHFDVKVNAPK
jgi:hypothetical protein